MNIKTDPKPDKNNTHTKKKTQINLQKGGKKNGNKNKKHTGQDLDRDELETKISKIQITKYHLIVPFILF